MDSIVFKWLCALVLLLTIVSAESPPKSKIVRCAVCESLVRELHDEINKVDPRKKVDVGSYRLDKDGKQNLAAVKYAGSEMHMTDVLESVCDSFKDYAQARHKETGKMEVIKLVVNGAMNPRFSEYEMIQDPDLNRGLNYHCDSVIEDFEDEILAHFRVNSEVDVESSQLKFCTAVTGLCRDVRDEL